MAAGESTLPVFHANEMQRLEPCEQEMQIEERVFKEYRDAQKEPQGGTVPPSVTPTQYANVVHGQKRQQEEVCLGPFAAVHVHFSNQATRSGLNS